MAETSVQSPPSTQAPSLLSLNGAIGSFLLVSAVSAIGDLISSLFVKRVRVVNMRGVIMGGQSPAAINFHSYNKKLEEAFQDPRACAVALIIDSPGGSPAESSLIFKRIRELADKHKKPTYAFVESVAASGGYYIAVAADKIIVDDNSLVGSIGVVMAGFGLHKVIERWEVERRVFTSGKNKVRLDTFQALKDDDVEFVKKIEAKIHANFKRVVYTRRQRLLRLPEADAQQQQQQQQETEQVEVKEQSQELIPAAVDDYFFNGDVWVGQEAVDRGVADEVGTIHQVLTRDLCRYRFQRIKLVPTSAFSSIIDALLNPSLSLQALADYFVSSLSSSVVQKVREEVQYSAFRPM